MSAFERDDVVRVVAATLGNGAPHPYAGRTGVVLEVRDAGLHPVRVQIGGRAVQFAAAELERHAGDSVSEISDHETLVRDVR